MIDPIVSVALAIHSTKGAYALLLGSGISRSARVPTGWEIVLDLIRKTAAISGESCEPDPESWFLAKNGRPADYSDLLDTLAKTPADRAALLKSYFEPNDEERTQGFKIPTAAHHAIAASSP
jgi:hypothetical protein